MYAESVNAPNSVGAGLPAMAVCQAALMLNVPAPSRASPLPQCSWMYAESVNAPNSVGAGLPAMAVCQAALMLNVPAPSRASPLL
ncbi:hypothetical protein F7R06_19665 [Pseudomonas moorei]|nr:hypothetical protein F7R06_19665 [Pseudomonas moorei]